MASTKGDPGRPGGLRAALRRVRARLRSVEERFRRRLPPAVDDVVSNDLIIGTLLGAGAGVWAIKASAVEGTESSDLIALAGAAVGLLAITLAVMALLIGFLNDRTERLIMAAGSVRDFFRPFKIVAIVRALAILAGVAGAIDASSVHVVSGSVVTRPGPTWLAVTLFGIAIWFFVWAVIGVTQLVGIFIDYGELRSRIPTTQNKNPTTREHLTPRLFAGGRLNILNTDGQPHPVENATAIAVLVVGLASFVLGLIVRNSHTGPAVHVIATATGLFALLVGLVAQMLSSTRNQRVVIVPGIIAGFVGLAIGLSRGGFVG